MSGNGSDPSRATRIDQLLQEVEDDLSDLIDFGKMERDVALEKVKEFDAHKRKSMGGQDGTMNEAIELKDRLDQEEEGFRPLILFQLS